jgi:hypothetical protein
MCEPVGRFGCVQLASTLLLLHFLGGVDMSTCMISFSDLRSQEKCTGMLMIDNTVLADRSAHGGSMFLGLESENGDGELLTDGTDRPGHENSVRLQRTITGRDSTRRESSSTVREERKNIGHPSETPGMD